MTQVGLTLALLQTEINSTYLIGLLKGLNETVHVKTLHSTWQSQSSMLCELLLTNQPQGSKKSHAIFMAPKSRL